MVIMFGPYLVVFSVSLATLATQLFLTQLLDLKTWNHVVYILISVSILGIGVGVNLSLLVRRLERLEGSVLSYGPLLLAFAIVLFPFLLIHMPLTVVFVDIIRNPRHIFDLLVNYLLIMPPFIISGFIITFVFIRYPQHIGRLYFFDLVGAGTGCLLYFFLINSGMMYRSLIIIALFLVVAVIFSSSSHSTARKFALSLGLGLLLTVFVHEPLGYRIDPKKGWEYIPGNFKEGVDVRHLDTSWHPLGRSDLYEFIHPDVASKLYADYFGTFQVNVEPRPPFSYFTNNFLAGTPVYHYSLVGDGKPYSVKLFSVPMEFPYLLLKRPKVMIIGVGGGRDAFFALTHQARGIVGAEVNERTWKTMQPGGLLHKYTGDIFSHSKVRVMNIEGRYLARLNRGQNFDLVVLNGVDTFSGLQGGFYAYAESYLYTTEAIHDYLDLVHDQGFVNLNRWFEPKPRETLRLFVMILTVLEDRKVPSPSEHVLIGANAGWGMTLIKKTPFTREEQERVLAYFAKMGVQPVYFPLLLNQRDVNNEFYGYARVLGTGKAKKFVEKYFADISPVSDNSPFFYKYYRFSDIFSPRVIVDHPVSGPVVFYSQLFMLLQSVGVMLVLVVVPLYLYRRDGLAFSSSPATIFSVLGYFTCLGLGFMFIEVTLIQKLSLLLESPKYSLPIVICSLLVGAGLGSYMTENDWVKRTPRRALVGTSVFVCLYLVLLAGTYGQIVDLLLATAFFARVLVMVACLLPLGFSLGIFFPLGLKQLSRAHADAVAWGWAINICFSVIGTVLAVMVAQFLGFNIVLYMAAGFYLCAVILGWFMDTRLSIPAA